MSVRRTGGRPSEWDATTVDGTATPRRDFQTGQQEGDGSHHREASKSCGIRQDDQMKSRRRFLMTLGGALASPRFALAQPAQRTYRVGWLSSGPRTEPYNMAFEQRLRELGFAEGRNLVIEFRTAQGRIEKVARARR